MPLRSSLQRLALKVHELGSVDPPPEGAVTLATYLHLGVAALAFALLLSRGLSAGTSFGIAVGAFIVLSLSLFHRRAAWVCAVLGTAFAGAAAAGLALVLSGVPAACGAGVLALALAVHTYARILRRPRRAQG